MSVDTMTTVFALLTVAANVGLLVILGTRFVPRGRAARDIVDTTIADDGLWVATIVAWVAMLGSLYLSEVANYVPCQYCWYQRIAMYPLALILLIAAVRRDRGVKWYAIPLCLIGGLIAVWHYVIQRFPSLAGESCDPEAPCSFTWVWEFSYVSIPFMALSAFALIGTILAVQPVTQEEAPDGATADVGDDADATTVSTEEKP